MFLILFSAFLAISLAGCGPDNRGSGCCYRENPCLGYMGPVEQGAAECKRIKEIRQAGRGGTCVSGRWERWTDPETWRLFCSSRRNGIAVIKHRSTDKMRCVSEAQLRSSFGANQELIGVLKSEDKDLANSIIHERLNPTWKAKCRGFESRTGDEPFAVIRDERDGTSECVSQEGLRTSFTSHHVLVGAYKISTARRIVREALGEVAPPPRSRPSGPRRSRSSLSQATVVKMFDGDATGVVSSQHAAVKHMVKTCNAVLGCTEYKEVETIPSYIGPMRRSTTTRLSSAPVKVQLYIRENKLKVRLASAKGSEWTSDSNVCYQSGSVADVTIGSSEPLKIRNLEVPIRDRYRALDGYRYSISCRSWTYGRGPNGSNGPALPFTGIVTDFGAVFESKEVKFNNDQGHSFYKMVIKASWQE